MPRVLPFLGLGLAGLVAALIGFFIFAALLMVSWNEGLVKSMNSSRARTIDYKIAMALSLFLMLLAGLFSCHHYVRY